MENRRVFYQVFRFGPVRQKISTENGDIPFLCINFFDTQNFLRHRSVPNRNFLVLRQKNLNEVSCIQY